MSDHNKFIDHKQITITMIFNYVYILDSYNAPNLTTICIIIGYILLYNYFCDMNCLFLVAKVTIHLELIFIYDSGNQKTTLKMGSSLKVQSIVNNGSIYEYDHIQIILQQFLYGIFYYMIS